MNKEITHKNKAKAMHGQYCFPHIYNTLIKNLKSIHRKTLPKSAHKSVPIQEV